MATLHSLYVLLLYIFVVVSVLALPLLVWRHACGVRWQRFGDTQNTVIWQTYRMDGSCQIDGVYNNFKMFPFYRFFIAFILGDIFGWRYVALKNLWRSARFPTTKSFLVGRSSFFFLAFCRVSKHHRTLLNRIQCVTFVHQLTFSQFSLKNVRPFFHRAPLFAFSFSIKSKKNVISC